MKARSCWLTRVADALLLGDSLAYRMAFLNVEVLKACPTWLRIVLLPLGLAWIVVVGFPILAVIVICFALPGGVWDLLSGND